MDDLSMNDLNMEGRLKLFHKKHGGHAIRIEGWWVYSDGAMREVNPHGAWCEPPVNVHERCKIIVSYREELLQRAVNEFHEAKELHLMEAKARLNWGDPPPGMQQEIVAKLSALQAEVKKRQQQLHIARKKLEVATPDWKRANQRISADNKQANEKLISAISNVKI